MKSILLMIFLISISNTIFSQDDCKVGFIDHEGTIVIEPKFVSALPFSEGLSVVKYEGFMWFIDANGDYFIKQKYLDAKSFSEGLAPVMESKEKGWGFINKQGKYIIQPNPEYLHVEPFYEGLALVVKKDINGSKKYGYLTRNGKIYIECKYDDALSFSEGYAAVKVKEKWGYIDKFGIFVVEPKYDKAFQFSEGWACVANKRKDNPILIGYDLFFIDPKGVVQYSITDKFSKKATSQDIDLDSNYTDNKNIKFNEGFVLLRIDEPMPEEDPNSADYIPPPSLYIPKKETDLVILSKNIILGNPAQGFFTNINSINEGILVLDVSAVYDIYSNTFDYTAVKDHHRGLVGNVIIQPYNEGFAVFRVNNDFLKMLNSEFPKEKQFIQGQSIYDIVKKNRKYNILFIFKQYVNGEWITWKGSRNY